MYIYIYVHTQYVGTYTDTYMYIYIFYITSNFEKPETSNNFETEYITEDPESLEAPTSSITLKIYTYNKPESLNPV